MTCPVCAIAFNGLCPQCISEGALLNPTCEVCNHATSFEDCELMSCGDHAHAKCSELVQKFGCCPGSCWERLTYKPTQIGRLQWDLKCLIFISHYDNVPLYAEDVCDLVDEELWWVLSCIYHQGVGVEKNEKLSEKFFKRALESFDPAATYYQAVKKKDMLIMQKAAVLGHCKAIRSMANYYMGASVLEKMRPIDMKMVAKYVAMGKDAMCRASQAIRLFKEIGVEAESALRIARHYFTTPAIYSKVTTLLAGLYSKRKEHHRAIALLKPVEKDEDVWLALGLSYSAVGEYDDAIHCFVSSGSSEAYISIAKLMTAKIVHGEESDITQLMTLAGNNPEAAFYFLSKGDLAQKDAEKYVRMIGSCQNEGQLLFFMKEFRSRKQIHYFKLCKDIFNALRKK